jgi:hypothetical protein
MKPHGYIIKNNQTNKYLSDLGDWSETLCFSFSNTKWTDKVNSSLVISSKKEAESIKNSILKDIGEVEIIPVYLSINFLDNL